MNEEQTQKQTGIDENQEQISQGIFPQYSTLFQQHPTDIPMHGIQYPQNEENPEKKRISNRLSGFNAKDNIAWKEITRRFGSNIKQPELLSIAQAIANCANIRLDRDAKRRKSVLIKWFNENWNSICSYLNYVVLEDSPRQN